MQAQCGMQTFIYSSVMRSGVGVLTTITSGLQSCVRDQEPFCCGRGTGELGSIPSTHWVAHTVCNSNPRVRCPQLGMHAV